MLRKVFACVLFVTLITEFAEAQLFRRSRYSAPSASPCANGVCSVPTSAVSAEPDSLEGFDHAYAAYRQRSGLRPLIRCKQLDDDCLTQGLPYYIKYGSHQPHSQRNNPTLENACMGADDPADALRMWINSSGHRSTLLRNAKYYGIARRGTYYVMRVADIGWEPSNNHGN